MMIRSAVLLVGVLVLGGCASVNPFTRLSPDYTEVPREALLVKAREIEQQIAAGERNPVLTDSDGIVLNTPEIVQAVRTRALRNELVDKFLNSGHGLEERSGLVRILRTAAYKQDGTSRDRDRNALLVMSENDNRWTLYEGLLDANNWSPKSLGAVQEVFFEARLEQLESGQKYEGPDGQAVVK